MSKAYGDRVRLFRNYVGATFPARAVGFLIKLIMQGKWDQARLQAKKLSPIRIGVEGSPDLQGFVQINGRLEYLGVEVKAPGGRQRPEQKKFQSMIDRLGGHYLLCDSVDDAVEKVGDILN